MRELKEIVAEKITFLRRQNKMTQAELADKLNYSDKSVSKWERAEALPDVEVLVAISRLFNVSLDYLTSEEDASKSVTPLAKSQQHNHMIISALAVLTVWTIATLIFVFCQMGAKISPWTVFVWAVPASAIVGLVFNGIWGRHWLTFVLCSVLVWSIILSCYLQFLSFNLWPMFIVGIPAQIIIIVWSRLKRTTKIKTPKADDGKSDEKKEK